MKTIFSILAVGFSISAAAVDVTCGKLEFTLGIQGKELTEIHLHAKNYAYEYESEELVPETRIAVVDGEAREYLRYRSIRHQRSKLVDIQGLKMPSTKDSDFSLRRSDLNSMIQLEAIPSIGVGLNYLEVTLEENSRTDPGVEWVTLSNGHETRESCTVHNPAIYRLTHASAP